MVGEIKDFGVVSIEINMKYNIIECYSDLDDMNIKNPNYLLKDKDLIMFSPYITIITY